MDERKQLRNYKTEHVRRVRAFFTLHTQENITRHTHTQTCLTENTWIDKTINYKQGYTRCVRHSVASQGTHTHTHTQRQEPYVVQASRMRERPTAPPGWHTTRERQSSVAWQGNRWQRFHVLALLLFSLLRLAASLWGTACVSVGVCSDVM